MRTALEQVWYSIEDDYNKGLINSERCLQASYYRALRSLLNGEQWRVFIEPEMNHEGSKFPDIVICHDENIMAVIELKFVPHDYSTFAGDLEKLSGFSRQSGVGFPIELHPLTGKITDKKFFITPETWFVFSVVTRADAKAVSFDDIKNFIKPDTPIRFIHQIGKTPVSSQGDGVTFESKLPVWN